MEKKYIKLSDVKRIMVVAPGASGVNATIIWKNVGKENIKFEAEYHYDNLEEGWKYCPYCGNIYKPTVHPTIDKCGCEEKHETMTSVEEINHYIWNCLEDTEPMDVTFDYGDSQETFSLRN